MHTPQATEGNWRTDAAFGRALGRLALVAVAFAVGLSTGCNALQGSKDKKHDPLFGDHVPKDGGSGPSKVSANVPPIPSASSSSNAALAMATLPGAKQLAIGEPDRPPVKVPTAGTLTSAAAPAVVPPGGNSPGVVPSSSAPTNAAPTNAASSRPQPMVVAVPRDSEVQTAAGSNQDQTSEYFMSQLRARGVSWHRADSIAGGIRFACIVPNRQNPSVTRVFEATAADFPSAVNAVLRQIDNQQ